ncbi:MAG: glutathione S-transferase C-terminal domain-containing protein, partial [Gammaproteobacteria bacterium]|nr:glutathione S-transferase C-terminal domain-containing protein [Gammaproteobacteria bacterium]
SAEQKNAWYAHWIAEGLGAAEALLARQPENPYCFGSEPSLADVCLIPQIANAARMNCDLSPYPRLLAVYEHCQAQPAFKAAAPTQQPDYTA